MKSTTTLVPIFLLLLSTFIVSHLPSATAAAAAVVDVDGDVIRNGRLYYIVSFLAQGGGVDLAANGNETCALTIVQAIPHDDKGKLVVISSPSPSDTIYEGSRLHLSFTRLPECAPTPSEWTVVKVLPDQPSALKITGYDGTVSGLFAIEKYLLIGSYKLTFCPRSDESCSDVVVRIDKVNGQRTLALAESNETPLLVNFQKPGSFSGRIEKA